jgi:hypothetical protein
MDHRLAVINRDLVAAVMPAVTVRCALVPDWVGAGAGMKRDGTLGRSSDRYGPGLGAAITARRIGVNVIWPGIVTTSLVSRRPGTRLSGRGVALAGGLADSSNLHDARGVILVHMTGQGERTDDGLSVSSAREDKGVRLGAQLLPPGCALPH